MARERAEAAAGKVTCAAWVRRRDDDGLGPRLLVAFGRGATPSSPPLLDLLAFDAASEPLGSPSSSLRAHAGPFSSSSALLLLALEPD
ncbi:hypothetical protein PR202_ga13817 [Eleusine coracana subsp. coracana]|uniref:Uncharacterized protein n=1 Tax=Eleusine coracana subsp. coracana TaxID=191504 RepID=A0AAV5CF05_ELECO|nr:hypothetical protein PR202_ga13817 [Eleusine coracana subsp. coracana]